MERQEEHIRRVMTLGSVEVAVALLVHLAGLGFYVYVHVLDGTNLKKTEGKGVPGIDVFGGRWKFLTYINLVNSNCVIINTIFLSLFFCSGCSLRFSFCLFFVTSCLTHTSDSC